MATLYGIGGLNSRLNASAQGQFTTKLSQAVQGTIIVGRVKSIVLESTHPRFDEVGGWNGLGAIEFDSIILPYSQTNSPIAKPVLSNTKLYPLVNEVVYLILLPNSNLGETTGASQYYYINPVALWNHPHHNAYPANPDNRPPEQRKDYIQTSFGSVRRITDNSSEISLGNTFKERANIHPLLPFEGDYILEGRWGNSIRLGSTVLGVNNWSTSGEQGDPITIIRNGQPQTATEEGWIPIQEDVNQDRSTIYLTTSQQIPIQPSITSPSSYDIPPTATNLFTGPQIILTSDRLVLNSKKDSILLSANTSLGLAGRSSVNITSRKSIVLDSPNIRLGSTAAKEPLLKGQLTTDLLKTLINNLNEFMKVCQDQAVPIPNQNPIPLTKLNQASIQMSQVLEGLLEQVDQIKSQTNFTT